MDIIITYDVVLFDESVNSDIKQNIPSFYIRDRTKRRHEEIISQSLNLLSIFSEIKKSQNYSRYDFFFVKNSRKSIKMYVWPY